MAQSSAYKDRYYLSFGCDATSSTTSYTSEAEAQSYYAGPHPELTLLYRTGKEQWSPPRRPEAQRRLQELRDVFTHPIANVWNHDLSWKVVQVMNTRSVNIHHDRTAC